ncbi:MAG TPA: glycosyltransferase [Bacteroidia bacterium]|nr:glycosyltransferase [Bacteroidia bacterium]HNS13261.1 glycosyltransferase [Bacteroidia bacterium]
MKVALVQDWFVVNGGAEKVVREIIAMYPDIEIFSLVDFLSDEDRDYILAGKKVHTSYLQKIPFAKKHYRNFLLLFPHAIESLDFSAFDLIISSSSSVAKGIKKTNKQIHVCYCHSPVRYAWDLKDAYLSSMKWPKRSIAKYVLAYIRKWDLKTSNRVDLFLANSKNVAERIRRIYNRDSVVVHPPCDTKLFTPEEEKDDYYFTSLRMVPYKRLDLIVKTFNELPDKKLIVSGEGPDMEKIKAIAAGNITFVGFVKQAELVKYFQKAKAFILAAEEDFGITSLEAQSCCTPVIAYAKGGYLETVIPGKTGVFFKEQTVQSLKNTILEFEKSGHVYKREDFLNNVASFTQEKFRTAFKDCIDSYVERKG